MNKAANSGGLVIPNKFAALTLKQADCFAFASVENNDNPERFRGACRAQKSVVVISGVPVPLV